MQNYFNTRYVQHKGRKKVWKAIAEYIQRFINEENTTIVELGSGYADFINNIKAEKKFAIDLNKSLESYVANDVKFFNSSVTNLNMFDDKSIDVVFCSNLLEHLDDFELESTFNEIKRITRKKAQFIIIQPNFRYCYKEYFDDYTHKKIFSHISLVDFVKSFDFVPVKVYPRFLPFSMKSILPKNYFLTKIYLNFPLKLFAKQMLLIFEKRGNNVA
jgi:ubiquinone/menaquinone biosynthesis C-methylase UbiE